MSDQPIRQMSDPWPSTRRDFLSALGATTLGASSLLRAQGAEIPGGLASDMPRELWPTQADLGSLFPEVDRIAAGNRYADSFLGGRFASFAEFRAAARARVLEVLRYEPEPVAPQAELLERVDCGDYFREKVLFSTTPVFRVPGYVLVPKKLDRPAPAIIDLHSHGGMFLFGKEKVIDLGANHPAMEKYHLDNYDGRPTATEFVRRGYVVISIDAFMFGERRTILDADLSSGWDRSRYSMEDVLRLNQQCRAKEATLVKALVLAGATWPGIVFWDDMRTVDYLAARPEVDPARIGCVGISMGGYRSMFLTALDSRIRAGCVVGFMSTVRPMIRAHVDTHSWVHFLPELHRYLDWPDVVSLAAPRSLLVQQCAKDSLFPLEGMKESVEKIAAVYEGAGAREKFSGRFYDEPHLFTRAMQDDTFAWFDEQLA